LKKTILISIIFGLLGITIEVIFTAFYPLFSSEQFSWSLEGNSYIWMFFIYALINPLFELGYPKVKNYNIIIRLLIYSSIIFAIEFSMGFILEKLTGKCPWEYSTGLTFFGYIRLDYIFFWMVFGYLIEKIYLLLNRVICFDRLITKNSNE